MIFTLDGQLTHHLNSHLDGLLGESNGGTNLANWGVVMVVVVVVVVAAAVVAAAAAAVDENKEILQHRKLLLCFSFFFQTDNNKNTLMTMIMRSFGMITLLGTNISFSQPALLSR